MKKTAKNGAPKAKAKAKATPAKGLSAEERAAMKETMKERAREAKGALGEKDLLAKVAEMSEPDRSMAKRLHALVMASAPDLSPRTWYGMPAYARDGEVVCFFQSADKFKSRYATFGFSDKAKLDDGAMWPTSFALRQVGAAEETRVAALVKKAVGS